MTDKLLTPACNPKRITRPKWTEWNKRSAWRLSDAVALSLNVSPNFLEKLQKSHPNKYKSYEVRLKTVECQKPGSFEFYENHQGNGTGLMSKMVSPQSFVSFVIRKMDWENLSTEFIEIGQINDSPSDNRDTKISRKASDKFIAALIRLLVEIGCRVGKTGDQFSVDAMPGIRADFFKLARRFDENLNLKSADTFETYIKGLCKFKGGSVSSSFYNELFPDYPPKIVKLEENNFDSSNS